MSKTTARKEPRNPLAVARKLTFIKPKTGNTPARSVVNKLAKSKVISKKPVTIFKEFSLSHKKANRRRVLLDDLLKQRTQQPKATKDNQADPLPENDCSVRRKLFFGK